MSYDIGPRLGIDGEAQFKSAISAVNANIKALGAEMKAVTAEFSNNEKSMAALISKNAVLEKQISAAKEQISVLTSQFDKQKSKLNELGEALEKAKKEFGENSEEAAKAQNAYNRQSAECSKLQAQINNATASLNGMTNELSNNERAMGNLENTTNDAAENVDDLSDATKDADKAMDAAEGSASDFSDVLKDGLAAAAKAAVAAVAAASAAVLGFAKSAVGVGMEFDASMSQVAATMGKTTDEISELRDFALQMGSTTAFSASQAADALNYMALAGYDAETSMAMLPNVLNLAAAGGIELAQASDMVTDAQSALGLSIEETAQLVDMMAKASSKSNTSVAQLGEAFLTVGGTARNLAGGTTELSTALGILADNGIKGAEGGTALRNIILSLSTPTDKAKDALLQFGGAEKLVYDEFGNMRSLNDVFSDLNDIMGDMQQNQRTELLNTMFNKTDLKAVNALLVNTVTDITGMAEALEHSGVNWDKYADKAWAADGAVGGLIDDLTYNLVTLGTSAKELQEYLQFEYNLDAEDALKAIETVQNTVLEQGSRWDELTGYIEDAEGAASKMAETQLDNLSGDIVKFQSALEGAQIAVSDKLTPTLREFVQFGSEAVSTLSTAFQEGGLSEAMDALGAILSEGLNMVIAELPGMIDAGMQLLGALGRGLVDNLPAITDAAADIIVMLLGGLMGALPNIAAATIEIVSTLITSIGESLPMILDAGAQMLDQLVSGIESGLSDMISRLPQIIDDFLGFITESLPSILDEGVELLNSLVNGILKAIPDMLDALPDVIDGIITFVADNLPAILSSGIDILMNLVDGIINTIPKMVEKLPEIITKIVSTLAQNLPKILSAGAEILMKLWDGISAALPNLLRNIPQLGSNILKAITNALIGVVDIGKNIVSGVWQGIQDMTSWIKDKVSGFFSGIVDGVKGLLGIASPSKVFASIGGYMAEGLGEGFSDEIGAVQRQIERSMDEVVSNASGTVDVTTQSISMVTGGGFGGMDPAYFADAIRAALDGAGVYLYGRKVGNLITAQQSNSTRAKGICQIPV